MSNAEPASWSSSFRLTASEKWRAKSAAMGHDVTEAFVNYCQPQPGMKVLDLASGTGEPGISLAQRVAPKGSVAAFDQSSELLEIASERARSKHLTNITTHQGDAHSLPFPDHDFDLVSCRFGIMFFNDVRKALTEVRRVLKPGARACFAAWGSIEQPFWQSTMQLIHRHVGGDLLPPGSHSPFRFSALHSLSNAMRDAGFHDLDESPENLPWTWHGDATEVFEYACAIAAPFRPMIERVPQGSWPGILADAQKEIEKYRVDNEIRFRVDVIMASGKA